MVDNSLSSNRFRSVIMVSSFVFSLTNNANITEHTYLPSETPLIRSSLPRPSGINNPFSALISTNFPSFRRRYISNSFRAPILQTFREFQFLPLSVHHGLQDFTNGPYPEPDESDPQRSTLLSAPWILQHDTLALRRNRPWASGVWRLFFAAFETTMLSTQPTPHSSRKQRLTTHGHAAPKFKTRRVIPPLPHTSPWLHTHSDTETESTGFMLLHNCSLGVCPSHQSLQKTQDSHGM